MIRFFPTLMTISFQLLLVFYDWQIVHKIADNEAGNIEKNWLSPIPGFSVSYFPFVVSSGNEYYSLINVSTGKMQPFIRASSGNFVAMQPFLFAKDENNTLQIHTTSQIKN